MIESIPRSESGMSMVVPERFVTPAHKLYSEICQFDFTAFLSETESCIIPTFMKLKVNTQLTRG